MKNLNFINARKKKQLTQAELAKLLKFVSKATISNWETGYSKPRLEMALTVSEILDEDVAFLFGYNVQESCTKNLFLYTK
ncbi:helix-turn-helix transcriptional regulator [Lysinibacillus fusiformis]|uniref:helix-turn-helix transcriptional regulator n=1 Tax=Lysinibacillus fusiformis TaxID=28031 RepID=UPI0037F823B4